MNRSKRIAFLAAATVLGLATGPVLAANSFTGAMKDAWLTGRIETLFVLNEHLSPLAIETTVDNGVAHLAGTVDSSVDRELAEELVRGIDGVTRVQNDLVVAAPSEARTKSAPTGVAVRRDFGTWVDDATTTAAVKSRLIANSGTKGLQIDVDTLDDIVTLSGRVKTDEERALAEQIARNTKDVETVHNNLVVDPS